MNKASITYSEIVKQIADFNKIRGWDPVPEDVAKSISIEAAELLEHFQWDVSEKMKNRRSKNWKEISCELADIFWYLVTFCAKADINLLEAVGEKIELLKKKYPEKYFNGKSRPEVYYKIKAEYRKGRIQKSDLDYYG